MIDYTTVFNCGSIGNNGVINFARFDISGLDVGETKILLPEIPSNSEETFMLVFRNGIACTTLPGENSFSHANGTNVIDISPPVFNSREVFIIHYIK